MPGFFSRRAVSPEARKRIRLFTIAGFGLAALIGWWRVLDEGATPARLIGAAASTVVALLEAFLPKRRRMTRRLRPAGRSD